MCPVHDLACLCDVVAWQSYIWWRGCDHSLYRWRGDNSLSVLPSPCHHRCWQQTWWAAGSHCNCSRNIAVDTALEYACPAWHTSLTKQQTTSLGNIQRRTLQIIAGNIPYDAACCLFKLTSLSERQDSLCSKLFRQLVSQSHILHCLLPAQRDDSLTGRLQPRNKYPTVHARTNRFKNSFIPHAIANYQ